MGIFRSMLLSVVLVILIRQSAPWEKKGRDGLGLKKIIWPGYRTLPLPYAGSTAPGIWRKLGVRTFKIRDSEA